MQFCLLRAGLATTAAVKRAVAVGVGAVAVAAVLATATAAAAATAGCTFLRGNHAAGIKIGHGAKADTTKEITRITRVAAHNKCLPFQIQKDSFRIILCRNGAKGAALLQIL